VSLPLTLLIGGALFLAVRHFGSPLLVVILAAALVAWELWLDLRAYRRPGAGEWS